MVPITPIRIICRLWLCVVTICLERGAHPSATGVKPDCCFDGQYAFQLAGETLTSFFHRAHSHLEMACTWLASTWYSWVSISKVQHLEVTWSGRHHAEMSFMPARWKDYLSCLRQCKQCIKLSSLYELPSALPLPLKTMID